MTLTAIIVDDEPPVRADLRQLLLAHPVIEIVGEAETLAESRALVAKLRPELIFLDVQLRGGSGLDLIPELDPATAVVFVSAHDRYAVRAFEVNALDYLLKPVAPERLAKTVSRIQLPSSRAPQAESRLSVDDRLFVRHDRGQRFVSPAEILVVRSIGGNYTSVELADEASLVVRRTLKEWEQVLPSALFRRVHRASIANLARAREIERVADGSLIVTLFGRAAPIEISRRNASEARAFLSHIAARRGDDR